VGKRASCLSASGREGAGDGALLSRSQDDGSQRPVEIERVLVSTQHSTDLVGGSDQAGHQSSASSGRSCRPTSLRREAADGGPGLSSRQSDRQVRARRPDGDNRLTRRKIIVDNVRAHGSPRRRRLLWQGSDQGGSLSRLCSAVRREEHRPRPRLAERCEVERRLRNRRRAIPFRSPCGRSTRRSDPRRPARAARSRALRPAAGPRSQDLASVPPIYRKTAAYEHFRPGHHDFTWERTERRMRCVRPRVPAGARA